MKRALVVAAACAIWGLPAVSLAAPARQGGYVSGFLGVHFTQDTDVSSYNDYFVENYEDRVEFDPGIAVGGAVGYDFGLVRLEGEMSWRGAEIDSITDKVTGQRFGSVDGDVGVFAVMANAFVDIHNDSPVTPYLGGGIGIGFLYLDDTSGINWEGYRVPLYSEGDDAVFAYQVGAGVEIALNRQVSLDVGYRYFGTTEATIDDEWPITTKMKFESHNVLLGVRVKF